ncbi:MAG: hypothetical protein RIU67_1400 [Actinomycetota bacterium]|jgi:hypothetical protein
MTIRRRESWGVAGDVPPDIVWCESDREVAAAVIAGDRPVGVATGDLARTLGAIGRGVVGVEVGLDMIEVEYEVNGRSRTIWAAAHCIARAPKWRGGWWRGAIDAVMNAQYVSESDVAPRGHPNDGRAEWVSVDAAMPVRQRWAAWRRLPRGEHVPHPDIRSTSVSEAFASNRCVLVVDGVRIGAVDAWRARVHPDRATVWVATTS